MVKVVPGRVTHRHSGELVIFLIGMTINKPWRVDRWWPAFRAMPKMLRELSEAEDSGLLGHRLMLEGRNPTLIQYWDSLDRLYAYASARDAEHWPAWRAFNRRAARASNAVGIWHETYVSSHAETVYVNTPELGLGRFTDLAPLHRTEPLVPADPDTEAGTAPP
ncbi:monooxygenase family protein [Actinophytocola glycyrrhizae]|uniref:Monooxygenase family protein n=1 Tax=Actinophytocola glycyrrhizae TaxID=2044873 RepID=A0ABV9RTY1_9PSEU